MQTTVYFIGFVPFDFHAARKSNSSLNLESLSSDCIFSRSSACLRSSAQSSPASWTESSQKHASPVHIDIDTGTDDDTGEGGTNGSRRGDRGRVKMDHAVGDEGDGHETDLDGAGVGSGIGSPLPSGSSAD